MPTLQVLLSILIIYISLWTTTSIDAHPYLKRQIAIKSTNQNGGEIQIGSQQQQQQQQQQPQQQQQQQQQQKLSVEIIHKVVEFTSKDPQKEIDNIEKSRPQSSIEDSTNNERPKDYPQSSAWMTFISNFRKKKKYRSRRRRHKRGAQINHDDRYITKYPTNKRLYKLANRLGYYLRIHFNGSIDGTLDMRDDKTILMFESHGPSVLRIRGVLSGQYLIMDTKGKLSAEPSPSLSKSLFRLNHEENSWDTYASFKYYFDDKFDMLVGITKEGSVKNPWKALPGQHATQYLTIPYV